MNPCLNISEQWYIIMESNHMNLLLIPMVLLTSVSMLFNPVLFLCILCFTALRQETRYVLLANTLFADMLFLAVNMTMVSYNSMGQHMPMPLCEFMMVSIVMTYSTSVLTVTLMVIDTYVAVRWPLRYNELLPPSRVRKIILSIWLIAAMCPGSLLVVFQVVMGKQQSCRLCLVLIALQSLEEMKVGVNSYFIIVISLCTALIVYCYIHLYIITKTSGIWRSRYSRARMTLLAHALLLMMYFVPPVVFMVELGILKKDATNQVTVWIELVNMCVLMLLPRCCTPYLYILRYREIYKAIQQVLWKRRPQGVA